MNQHKIKTFRRQLRKNKQALMMEFFDSLKEVGLILRLKVCYRLIFTNFKLFDKKIKQNELLIKNN